MAVYREIVDYISTQEKKYPDAPPIDPSHLWQRKLSRLLDSHPYLVNPETEDEDVCGHAQDDTPDEIDFSLSSSDGEEEEEEGEGPQVGVSSDEVIPGKSTRNVMMQKKKVLV